MKKILFLLFFSFSLFGYDKVHNIHEISLYLANGTSKKACRIQKGKYEWQKNGLLMKDFDCSIKGLSSSRKVNFFYELKSIERKGFYIFIHNNLIEGKYKRNNNQDLSFNFLFQ